MAIACFFLASKVEECVVKLKDIIHAYYSLKKLNPSEAVSITIVFSFNINYINNITSFFLNIVFVIITHLYLCDFSIIVINPE